MLISSHCHHPRVNIGLVATVSNNRTIAFMRTMEQNWQKSAMWDQALWDAMLHNHDELCFGCQEADKNLTWSKLDCCVFAEGAKTFRGQHVNCASNDEIFTWHLTSVPLDAKLLDLIKFYERNLNLSTTTHYQQSWCHHALVSKCSALWVTHITYNVIHDPIDTWSRRRAIRWSAGMSACCRDPRAAKCLIREDEKTHPGVNCMYKQLFPPREFLE